MNAGAVDGTWRLRATCPQENPDWWITEGGYLSLNNQRAQGICNRICPVRAECDAEYQKTRPALRRNTIAGGRVYDQHGQPAANVRTAARKVASPARKCRRPECTVWLPAGCRVDQKYHSAECGKAHRHELVKRDREQVAA